MAVLTLTERSADYQSFAAEHPEELARAIQKGIPATLRGMMWQHMWLLSLVDCWALLISYLQGRVQRS
jgi:hypothetical protein